MAFSFSPAINNVWLTKPPRAFSDYTVTVDESNLPEGITVHHKL